MHSVFRRKLMTAILTGLALVILSGTSLAQYKKTNLVSNLPTGANHQDTQLRNAWGLAYAPGNPFWISDEYTGLSTLYDGTGVKQSRKINNCHLHHPGKPHLQHRPHKQ